MASHEAPGKSDEWYTPEWVFQAMDIRFDLDPCCGLESPAEMYCGERAYSDGLGFRWSGSVWLNPPYGGRNGITPWLERLAEHGDGIALVPNRTGAAWWQEYAQRADCLIFVKGKIKFITPWGDEGKSPGYGNVLMAYGSKMAGALNSSAVRGLRA